MGEQYGNSKRILKKTTAGGITGIIVSGAAPAFAQDMGILKIGQLGLGSH